MLIKCNTLPYTSIIKLEMKTEVGKTQWAWLLKWIIVIVCFLFVPTLPAFESFSCLFPSYFKCLRDKDMYPRCQVGTLHRRSDFFPRTGNPPIAPSVLQKKKVTHQRRHRSLHQHLIPASIRPSRHSWIFNTNTVAAEQGCKRSWKQKNRGRIVLALGILECTPFARE